MTFEERRKELIEIDKKIEALMARKLELNPFAELKSMSNKQFGEQWSESYIREKCPNLIKNNGRGHDVITMNGEKWEIKSIRLPCKNTAFNQCHPFGRANKLSVQFVKASLLHSDYISFIQPISQLNQNRTMKDTELLFSEDLGKMNYNNKPVHCCLNIYHKCVNGHRQDFSIPGILECRHIFRSGKYKHDDKILNTPWDFRVSAWGNIKLLENEETCPNEIVFLTDENTKEWLSQKLKMCNYKELLSCVSTPNLPAWRLKKWLKEEYQKDHGEA